VAQRARNKQLTPDDLDALAEMLVAAGAEPAVLDPVQAFAAACMRADRATVDDLTAADPGLPARAIATDPGLIIRAAEHGRLDAVRLMAKLGFDVNVVQQVTPLHEAAYHGDLAMARLVIEPVVPRAATGVVARATTPSESDQPTGPSCVCGLRNGCRRAPAVTRSLNRKMFSPSVMLVS
jgi:hypothetical protein